MSKTILSLIGAVTLLCTSLNAQEPSRHHPSVDRKYPAREKFNPHKMVEDQGREMCFELDLDKERADKFMEIYKNYCSNLHAVLGERPKRIENPSDEDVEKMIFKDFDISHRILELRKEYYSNFRQVLSPKEIQKMYFIEKRKAHDFGPRPPMREHNDRVPE